MLHKLRGRPSAEADHILLDVMILSESHQRIAARCEEDVVIYDYRIGKKTPLPPFMRSQLEKTFALQEQTQESCTLQIQELLTRIRNLETASWDRVDAVEECGSAHRRH